MQSAPRRERGGQGGGQTLDSECVAECKQTGSDLELSDGKLRHAQLQTPDTTVFMSIWPSLTRRKKRLHSKDLANVLLSSETDFLFYANVYLLLNKKK